jgi:hypothetical protein
MMQDDVKHSKGGQVAEGTFASSATINYLEQYCFLPPEKLSYYRYVLQRPIIASAIAVNRVTITLLDPFTQDYNIPSRNFECYLFISKSSLYT